MGRLEWQAVVEVAERPDKTSEAPPDPDAAHGPDGLAAAPCYSMRLVRPFLAALSDYPSVPPELLEPLEQMAPDARMPITTLHELLRGALELTGDPDLGLRAASKARVGDYDVVEYASRTCKNGLEAAEVAFRYIRLLNDAADFQIEVEGDRVLVRLGSHVPLMRASVDFQMAALSYVVRSWLPERFSEPYEVCFVHPEPDDVSGYRKAFPGGRLRFGSPFDGFVLPLELMQRPLPKADPSLHQVLTRHAEQLLSELPRAESFTERVRSLLMDALPNGNFSAEQVADLLHVSRRTLTRRLAQEGTTYKELLDDMRHRLARRYLEGSRLDASEIAFLLGFSQAAAFYRAFRRWTGQTPLEYRRERLG